MNLLQLQDTLKGLPDQELQAEMVQPSGQVPQYLIMTEMQRRKTMREEYNARPQPPGTVADEFKAEAAQGLQGALQSMSNERTGPPQQMPLPAPKPQGYDPMMARDRTTGAPQGFAQGGLVGDKGGYRYISPQLRMRPDGTTEQLNLRTQQWEPEGQGLASQIQTPDYVPDITDPAAFGLPPNRDISIDGLASDANKAMYDWSEIDPESDPRYLQWLKKGVRGVGSAGSALDEYIVEPTAKMVTEWPVDAVKGAYDYMTEIPGVDDIPEDDGGLASVLPEEGYNFRGENRRPFDEAPSSPEEDEVSSPAASTRPAAVGGRGGALSPANDVEEWIKRFDYEPKGLLDLKEDIEARSADIDAQAEKDKWMGLANMGFAMAAGESPYFASNVGAGGLAGTEYWSEADAARAQREDAVLEQRMALEQAREAIRQGNLSTAATFYQAANDAQYKSGMLGLKAEELAITKELGLLGAGGVNDPDSLLKMAGELRQRIDDNATQLENLAITDEQRARIQMQNSQYERIYDGLMNRLTGGNMGSGTSLIDALNQAIAAKEK